MIESSNEAEKLIKTIQECCNKVDELAAELEDMVDELKYGWHPNDFDYFYVPEKAAEKGYVMGIWYECEEFQNFRHAVGVFRTPEEAEAKAKKLGYI